MKTGYVDVLEVTASHDVGTAINPALVKGQIYGGIVMEPGLCGDRGRGNRKAGQKTKEF